VDEQPFDAVDNSGHGIGIVGCGVDAKARRISLRMIEGSFGSLSQQGKLGRLGCELTVVEAVQLGAGEGLPFELHAVLPQPVAGVETLQRHVLLKGQPFQHHGLPVVSDYADEQAAAGAEHRVGCRYHQRDGRPGRGEIVQLPAARGVVRQGEVQAARWLVPQLDREAAGQVRRHEVLEAIDCKAEAAPGRVDGRRMGRAVEADAGTVLPRCIAGQLHAVGHVAAPQNDFAGGNCGVGRQGGQQHSGGPALRRCRRRKQGRVIQPRAAATAVQRKAGQQQDRRSQQIQMQFSIHVYRFQVNDASRRTGLRRDWSCGPIASARHELA
jgi:hypothetical protein